MTAGHRKNAQGTFDIYDTETGEEFSPAFRGIPDEAEARRLVKEYNIGRYIVTIFDFTKKETGK